MARPVSPGSKQDLAARRIHTDLPTCFFPYNGDGIRISGTDAYVAATLASMVPRLKDIPVRFEKAHEGIMVAFNAKEFKKAAELMERMYSDLTLYIFGTRNP